MELREPQGEERGSFAQASALAQGSPQALPAG